jgi:hypothetical protein
MPPFTVEQVKNLAPDQVAFKSGQGLANQRHWSNLGMNETAIWGECQGSAKEPYKVRVDLSTIGSACTCPSRKFPCKHALALMLLAASSVKIAQNTPPAWVTDWLQKRAARSEAAVKPKKTKTDSEPRQKEAARRAAKREKLAESGIETLEQWLKDFARLGLAQAQTAPAAFWDEQAARMVDCQLPGAARMIRELAVLSGTYPDWARALLLRLGRLYLLTLAYRRLDRLPEAAQQDVRLLLGWNVNQDELVAGNKGIRDDWLVLSSHTNEDEKTGLRTQINWLWGKTSRRPAQIINFAYRNQPLDAGFVPSVVLTGQLVFFPGAAPLRAVFESKTISGQRFVPAGYPALAPFLEEYACVLGKNPWTEIYPVVLEKVVPVQAERAWFLRDSESAALPLSVKFTAQWELFALSGGRPLAVFSLWDGFCLTPQAAWAGERFVCL